MAADSCNLTTSLFWNQFSNTVDFLAYVCENSMQACVWWFWHLWSV